MDAPGTSDTIAEAGSRSEAGLTRPSSPLRRNFIILFAAFFYTTIVLFAWVGTCILCYRPLNHPFWVTQDNYRSHYAPQIIDKYIGNEQVDVAYDAGSIMTSAELATNERWRVVVRTADYVSAILALALTSTVCARGAVVYMQASRQISLRQTLALADRSWSNIPALWQSLRLQRNKSATSPFLLYSIVICLLGTIIWPLQGILVTDEFVRVVINTGESSLPQMLAIDADITGLSQGPAALVINNVAAALASGSSSDFQPHLWQPPEATLLPGSGLWWQQCVNDTITDEGWSCQNAPLRGNESFVSALDKNIDTLLLTSHGFRLNSSLSCAMVSESDYPQACSNSDSFESVSQNILPSGGGTFQFRACAPSNLSSSPWDMTSRNRQDITESIYLQLNEDGVRYMWNSSSATSITIQCTGATTAGYFELPSSYINDATFGPLLETFNVTASEIAGTDVCNTLDNSPDYQIYNGGPCLGKPGIVPNISSTPTPGPLQTSMVALFGPGTWFSLRANSSSIGQSNTTASETTSSSDCTTGNIVPFGQLFSGSDYADEEIIDIPLCTLPSTPSSFNDVVSWLRTVFFTSPSADDIIAGWSERAFVISVFYANEFSLQQAAASPPWRRAIISVVAQETQKYSTPLWAMCLISVLLGLYLVTLWIMAFYACMAATWTNSLDAFAMMRLGAHLKDEGIEGIPLLTRIFVREVKFLDETNGWLGEDGGVNYPAGQPPDGRSVQKTLIGAKKPLREDVKYDLLNKSGTPSSRLIDEPRRDVRNSRGGRWRSFLARLTGRSSSPGYMGTRGQERQASDANGILLAPYQSTVPSYEHSSFSFEPHEDL